jgi:octaprenyl-diphosphate synthase
MMHKTSNLEVQAIVETAKTQSSDSTLSVNTSRLTPQDMTQSTQAALGSLAKSVTDRSLEAHLTEAQALLSDDLGWVEQMLRETAALGPTPGSNAARQLVELGGKRVRPMALLLCSACFGPVPPASRHMAVCVELIHSATLLHDDVIDEGTERRGQPAARVVWGNGVSVLSGDLLLTHALVTAQQHAPGLMPALLDTLRRLVEGEIIQLRGRTELDVSEAVYSSILRNKTAALFRFATSAGAELAGASERAQLLLADFGECIGMAFQLVDDLLDYSGDGTGKTMFADLRQGKMTLPLVLAVAERPELLEQLSRIRAGDSAALAPLRQSVISSGVCERVVERALGYTVRATEYLDQLAPSPARSLLRNVAEQLAERSR